MRGFIRRRGKIQVLIESSRSGMELLDAFSRFHYQGEVGPGVYDIHSPRIPTTEEM
ncbi:MAG: hypothetical protein LBC60_10210, partial [Spirochaetaceae bacterium]|nr:hypothetical protein [Spirochaetaceae bacterium]